MSRRVIADVSTAGNAPGTGKPFSPLVPALTIVSHPRMARVGERLLCNALVAGREVALSRNAPDFVKPGSALGLPLEDPFVSRKPIRLVPLAEGRIILHAGNGGPVCVAGMRVQGSVELGAGDLVAGVVIELADRVVLLLHLAPNEATLGAGQGHRHEMVGDSAGLWRVREHLARIADLTVPVLIRGETGTGKELVARAVHGGIPRRSGPFVSVNLGAVPRELAAAELFGARKGAYTGATEERKGFFGAARGGTLFLDELGEAPPEVQVMLLRVLETGEMFPVGGQTPVATDVRLIAATDADLEAQIRAGRFKAPLLHRLAGYEIRVPALRERREDIGPLFRHFAAQELLAIGEAHRLTPDDPYTEPWLPAALAVRLVRHDWPGNIRQLRNLTRQLVIGSRGRAQLHLDLELFEALGPAPETAVAGPEESGATVEGTRPEGTRRKASAVSEAELLEALRACEYELKPTADRLGIPRSSIYDLIARCPNVRTAGALTAAEITGCYRDSGGDVKRMVERLQVSAQALKRRLKEMGLGP
jgi:two-component system nitrogen regulation response regulator GlnG